MNTDEPLIETSLRLRSVLTKYSIRTDETPMNIWNVLNNKLISSEDIDKLIYVMGIQHQQRKISVNNRHIRPNRYYNCEDCSQFRLHFMI